MSGPRGVLTNEVGFARALFPHVVSADDDVVHPPLALGVRAGGELKA